MPEKDNSEKEVQKEGLVVFDNFKKLSNIKRSLTKFQLDYIQKTVAKDVRKEQLLMFIYNAMIVGADLLRGDMVGYTDSKNNLITIVTKDFKLKKAQSKGDLEFYKVEPIYIIKNEGEQRNERVKWWEGGTLVGAIAEVKRKSYKNPFSVNVTLKEYDRGNASWSKKETMIKKVALSQALTMAYPDMFGGIYEDAEIPTVTEVTTGSVQIDKPTELADKEQLKAINLLGGTIEDSMTKQEAVDEIKRLTKLKRKQK